jgi:hypothetical protein
MRPVLDLLTAEIIRWEEEHDLAVKTVMDILEEKCFLKLPSYDRPFHVVTDFS